MAAAFLLALLVGLPATSSADAAAPPADDGPGPASAALSVSVSESPDAVHLRIQASGDIEPGSLEIRFAGRRVVVLARDREGHTIRSERLRLPAAVVEDGASAGYDAEDALVMTLRKQGATQATQPSTDPEASAR